VLLRPIALSVAAMVVVLVLVLVLVIGCVSICRIVATP
jgi:hypothetical protein